jgi:uncharacterized membrane protein (UPF0127 family)
MKAINLASKKELASNLVTADRLFTRMKGLLGRSSLMEGEALWIKPCNGIHTFGMRFVIDAVFLNRENRVVAVVERLQPYRLTRLYGDAVSVIELPAGTIDMTATHIRDEIEIV